MSWQALHNRSSRGIFRYLPFSFTVTVDWTSNINKPFKNKTAIEVFCPDHDLCIWLGVKYEQNPSKTNEDKTVIEVFLPNNNPWGWQGVKCEQTLQKQNSNWSISPE